jgi:hypothetical protein
METEADPGDGDPRQVEPQDTAQAILILDLRIHIFLEGEEDPVLGAGEVLAGDLEEDAYAVSDGVEDGGEDGGEDTIRILIPITVLPHITENRILNQNRKMRRPTLKRLLIPLKTSFRK